VDAATRAYIDTTIAGLEPLARPASPPLGYGRDLVCLDDFDARFSETDPASFETLAQDAYHAVITELGAIRDAEDFGLGIARVLSAGRTPTELVAVGGRVDQALMTDDRIARSTTTTSFADETLRLSTRIEPEDAAVRPFTLVMAFTTAAAFLEAVL
jgi:hypothetical protein